MTWTTSSVLCSNITKIAAAGVLLAIPAAAVNVPGVAAASFSGAPAVLLTPPPADPPTIAPQPPPPPPSQGEYYNPQDPNDWWPYAGTGSF
jgi:hypothetical protein